MTSKKHTLFIMIILLIFVCPQTTFAKEKDLQQQRMALYKKTEALTQIPWYYLAAIDQYERHIKTNDTEKQLISIDIPEEEWFGAGNQKHHKDERIIQNFNGIGRDGDGDLQADPNNPEDILYTIAHLLASSGLTKDDIKIALWNYYERDLTVKTIMNTARIFKTYDTIRLTKRDFPVSLNHNYSYRNTWGDRRGFGGVRIHEGTDIFANYGTPVKSTTYGIIELMGWNVYGGWRIGIRDINNVYHYYAHLSDYHKDIDVGQIVEPGDPLGHVGSTGYGPPGTSGKFPPHLHYGMYKDNGYSEWSFDPYPYLRRWEQMAQKNKQGL